VVLLLLQLPIGIGHTVLSFLFFCVVVTDNGVLGHTITNVVGEEEGGNMYLWHLRRDMYSSTAHIKGEVRHQYDS
jgi:hypothetical protein